MNERSNRIEVRNPLLAEPNLMKEWLELRSSHPEAAAALQRMLMRLSKSWRIKAQQTWERHKAPMARYQRRNADIALDLAVTLKAAGVYARHLASAANHSPVPSENSHG
ncbi:hypothetical protein FHT32_004789 [Variovorax sp. SG517]|uniref:hypothetical protein n=1 Tax=Variovorax sp. SG517 TaxID=2587117 RepID=UPI00159E435F|nr:hypothetical protein [Variovorax sp. SG517]NVM91125.1 hypothetical protein [Variovorax sp. SG517]